MATNPYYHASVLNEDHSRPVVSEKLRPDRLAPTTTPHSESLKFPFFPVCMLVWRSTSRLASRCVIHWAAATWLAD